MWMTSVTQPATIPYPRPYKSTVTQKRIRNHRLRLNCGLPAYGTVQSDWRVPLFSVGTYCFHLQMTCEEMSRMLLLVIPNYYQNISPVLYQKILRPSEVQLETSYLEYRVTGRTGLSQMQHLIPHSFPQDVYTLYKTQKM